MEKNNSSNIIKKNFTKKFLKKLVLTEKYFFHSLIQENLLKKLGKLAKLLEATKLKQRNPGGGVVNLFYIFPPLLLTCSQSSLSSSCGVIAKPTYPPPQI
jgi:hypothetical protein